MPVPMANQAQDAIYAEIKATAEMVAQYDNAGAKAVILRNLAAAYRMTYGGAQPGGVAGD